MTLWQINVRAIALGLEALRKVERYGITRRGEQYAGWKQLPPGHGSEPSHLTIDQAYAVISCLTHTVIGPDHPEQSTRALIRKAKAATHPDRHSGDREQWDLVEECVRVMGYDT